MEKIMKNSLFIPPIAILCTILWGSAYPCIKTGYRLFSIAADDIGSKLLFAGIRFSTAGLLILLFLALTNRDILFPSKKNIPSILVLGLFQTTLQYVFFYIGLANTTGAKGAILNSAGTFLAVLAAPLIYSFEHYSFKKIAGCILGFMGIILVNLNGGSLAGFTLIGDGFTLLSTIFGSIAFFISKEICKKESAFTATGWQLFLGGILLCILGVFRGGHISFTVLPQFLLMGYMAMLSAVAFVLWTNLLAYHPVGKISIYNLAIPIFGTLLSGLFLGENIFTLSNISAAICVSFGIAIVNISDLPATKKSK